MAKQEEKEESSSPRETVSGQGGAWAQDGLCSAEPQPPPIHLTQARINFSIREKSGSGVSVDLLGFVTRSNDAKTAEQLNALLAEALRDLCGLTRYVFGLETDHPSIGLPAPVMA